MELNAQRIIASCIEEALKELELQPVPGSEPLADITTDSAFGDFTSNVALRLSRVMKRAPREVSSLLLPRIRRKIDSSALAGYLIDVKVEGAGFINFYLSDAYFLRGLQELLSKGSACLREDIGGGKKTLIEFVSANPTGPLSVAHARQAAVGDVLANILEFLGFRVEREYYLNDEGNQIAILGRSVSLRRRELQGESVVFPQDHYQGDYIYDIARQATGLAIPETELADFAAEAILGIIRQELDDFGVKFDTWYSQKALRQAGKIERVFEALKAGGFLYEQEGALWFRSTGFKDDKDRVVVKSDGSYTYLAPDIAYHEDKYLRGFDWLINLWGPDHHGYIPRLKAAVQALGKSAESLCVVIVQLATIFRDGVPVQMSTRRGQYITLREVLDEVGRDASRFFFLMRRTSSHLDFDLGVAKKQTPENPVYYVQYAYARISSILRNSAVRQGKDGIDLSVLREKEEQLLVRKLMQFPYVLRICLATVDPYMLTAYLQELAAGFHKFYDLHRVLGQEENITRARLALIESTRIVLGTVLDILGISKPENM